MVALSADLTVATDADANPLAYLFELDTLKTFDGADKLVSGPIGEGYQTTSWHVAGLQDDTLYYWRAKADDGLAESAWTVGSFFVSTANEAPGTPVVRNPGANAGVDSFTPLLEVFSVADPDRDGLSYQFEVYQQPPPAAPVAAGSSAEPAWTAPALAPNTWYFWRARAVDQHDAAGPWSELSSFHVNDNGLDDEPSITTSEPSVDYLMPGTSFDIQWVDADPDSNAAVALYYDNNGPGADGTPIVAGLTEDPDDAGDSYVWDLSGLGSGKYWVYGAIRNPTPPGPRPMPSSRRRALNSCGSTARYPRAPSTTG